MKLIVLVPAFNEELTISKVLADLKTIKEKNIKAEIVVVNDGSVDKTEELTLRKKVTIISHMINRGLGGALSTGLTYAKQQNADVTVTFDADGQHKASDVKRLIKPIINKRADVVIGIRRLGSTGMPWDRKIITIFANIFTFVLFNILVADSQSGLRAFSKKAIKKIDIKTNRMEVSSEILRQVKIWNLRLEQIPIKAIYSDYSRLKGQRNINAFNIAVKMLIYRFNKS